MGDVEAILFEFAICPFLRIPKREVCSESRDLRDGYQRVHIQRLGHRLWWILESERDRRPPINHERNFVIQPAVQRAENSFGVNQAAFLRLGAIGRCHSTTNPGPCRVNPVMATKRVGCGSTPDFGEGADGSASSSSAQKRFSGS